MTVLSLGVEVASGHHLSVQMVTEQHGAFPEEAP